jgi:hypothetical protein
MKILCDIRDSFTVTEDEWCGRPRLNITNREHTPYTCRVGSVRAVAQTEVVVNPYGTLSVLIDETYRKVVDGKADVNKKLRVELPAIAMRRLFQMLQEHYDDDTKSGGGVKGVGVGDSIRVDGKIHTVEFINSSNWFIVRSTEGKRSLPYEIRKNVTGGYWVAVGPGRRRSAAARKVNVRKLDGDFKI